MGERPYAGHSIIRPIMRLVIMPPGIVKVAWGLMDELCPACQKAEY